MWFGLLEDNNIFFAGVSECVSVGRHRKCLFALGTKNLTAYLAFVCEATNSVSTSCNRCSYNHIE